tara:strand:- start:3042 stop:3233 length:192 start_codon:yes stop_codon:yes gene_type:complete
LIEVARVHLKVDHVELVLHHIFSLEVDISSLLLTLLNDILDVTVIDVRPDLEDSIGSIVDHVL